MIVVAAGYRASRAACAARRRRLSSSPSNGGNLRRNAATSMRGDGTPREPRRGRLVSALRSDVVTDEHGAVPVRLHVLLRESCELEMQFIRCAVSSRREEDLEVVGVEGAEPVRELRAPHPTGRPRCARSLDGCDEVDVRDAAQPPVRVDPHPEPAAPGTNERCDVTRCQDLHKAHATRRVGPRAAREPPDDAGWLASVPPDPVGQGRQLDTASLWGI